MSVRKLYRDDVNKIIGGVCSGLSEYFETDPVILRIIFVFISFAGGSGILLYIILWIMLPEKHAPAVADKPEHPGAETEKPKIHPVDHGYSRSHANGIVGFFLILAGLMILLNNFFPAFYIQRFWPLLLIFFGLALLTRKRHH